MVLHWRRRVCRMVRRLRTCRRRVLLHRRHRRVRIRRCAPTLTRCAPRLTLDVLKSALGDNGLTRVVSPAVGGRSSRTKVHIIEEAHRAYNLPPLSVVDPASLGVGTNFLTQSARLP
eukprot:4470806-Prymnesium_polylepis.1